MTRECVMAASSSGIGSIYVSLSDSEITLKMCRKNNTKNSSLVRNYMSAFFLDCGYKIEPRVKINYILNQIIAYYGEGKVEFVRLKQDLESGNLKIEGIQKIRAVVIGYYRADTSNRIYVVQKLDDIHLVVGMIKEEERFKYRISCDYNEVVRDWLREYYIKCGVKDAQRADMLPIYMVAQRICNRYPNNTILSILDIMKDAHDGNICLSCGGIYKQMNTEGMSAVIFVERYNAYKDFLTFNVHMRTSLSSEAIKEWYQTYKYDLYKLLRDKCNSYSIRYYRNLSYYKMYSAKLGAGNILSLTFKLKDGASEMERQMQEEQRKKIETKEEEQAAKRFKEVNKV